MGTDASSALTMLGSLTVTVVTCLIAAAYADLGNTNPPYGSCLCMTADYVNVRREPGLSAGVIGESSRPNCHTYLGLRLTTDGYRWFKVNFNNQEGWIAGDFMRVGSSSQCSSGGGSCSSGNSRLTHSAAKRILDGASIPIYSSGGCSNRNLPYCTSLETIRCKCITDLVWFKEQSRCSVTVTGGTETGHAGGSQSHWNGYKIDISLSSCVDSYIQNRFTYIGIRGDGARMYRDSRRNIYAKEGNHWDILYP